MPDRPAEATADEIAGADLLLAARRMGLDTEDAAAALCTALWLLARRKEPERRLIAEMVYRAADEIAVSSWRDRR